MLPNADDLRLHDQGDNAVFDRYSIQTEDGKVVLLFNIEGDTDPQEVFLAVRDRAIKQAGAHCPFDSATPPNIGTDEPCPVCGMLGEIDSEVKCPFT